MLEILYVGFLDLSPAVSSQFTVEMCVVAKYCKKSPKPLFGGSWSFKIIDVNKSKKPVTNACYDMQQSSPICNRFHTIRANSGKITSFRGYPCLTPAFEGKPLTERHKILSLKTSVLGEPVVQIL